MTDTAVEPFGSTTPVLALPYPAATDPADVPHDISALANRIEAIYGQPNGLAGLDSSGKVPAASLPPASSTWMLIADTGALAAAAASIDLTAIPQTYTHLFLRTLLRGTGAANAGYLQINGDATAGNYQSVTGGSVMPGTAAGTRFGNPGVSTDAATAFPFTDVFIPFYRMAITKAMSSQTFVGTAAGAANSAQLYMLTWIPVAAINRLTITIAAQNLAAGNRAMLYGMN